MATTTADNVWMRRRHIRPGFALAPLGRRLLNPADMWRQATLIGVGLLGGSLGLALKKRRLAAKVVGVVRRQASVEECESLQAVDEASLDLSSAVANADLVVLCAPVGQMRTLGERMAPHLARGAVVTDVGSVKREVVRDLEATCGKAGALFVGSHPMAGGEQTGVASARDDLFEGAVCAITPTPATDAAAAARIGDLWRSLGARVLTLSPDDHDHCVGRSSHLPHLVAASLANYVLDPDHRAAQTLLYAAGFRDTMRVASGALDLWRDIAMANRDHLADALRDLPAQLTELKDALRRSDSDYVEAFLNSAKNRRDAWMAETGPRPI